VRSTSFVTRLLPRIQLRSSIIFRYRHNNVNDAFLMEDQNHRYIQAALRETKVPTYSITGDLWSVEDALMELDKIIREAHGKPEGLRILIDVSTFTKAYTLVFLRYLDEAAKRNDVTLFFTDIAGPQTGRPSRGLDRIIALPLYSTSYVQGRESLLLTFLGFEPQRVVGLWNRLEPNRTMPLYSLRRDGASPLRSTFYRDQLLNRPGVDVPLEVPTSPLDLARTLAIIYSEERDKYNVCLSATGNKLQCVGVYIFIKLTLAQVQMFYPVPAQYTWKYWNPLVMPQESVIISLNQGFKSEYIRA